MSSRVLSCHQPDLLTRLHPSDVGGHHQAMSVYQCTRFVRFGARFEVSSIGCIGFKALLGAVFNRKMRSPISVRSTESTEVAMTRGGFRR